MPDGSLGPTYNEPAIVSDPAQPAEPPIEQLRKMYEDWFDATADARKEALIDDDYYNTDQLSPAIKAVLRSRRQPDNVNNLIKPAINGILGVTERGRSDPRAFPRTPQDEDSADVVTDVLRYISDFNRFNGIKRDCLKDELIQGSMAAIVGFDNETRQVTVEQIRWEDFFHDPRSRRNDFRDAAYMGVAKWMYVRDAIALYPDKRDVIESSTTANRTRTDESNADKPETLPAGTWGDRRGMRVRVVEIYYKEGPAWRRACYVGAGVLEFGPSPYPDDKGKPTNPIEAQSAYVKRNNDRYGVVRDLRGPQDGVNHRESKLLHILSVSQIEVADPGAIEVNPDDARKEAARPDGVIPFGWRKVSTADMAAGQFQLLQLSMSQMQRLSPNPAVVGRDNEGASGRALQARTQAGLIELAPLYGGLEDWELRIYRQMWARAKHFWRAPMFIRVTDDEDAPKFVGLNQPADPMMGQTQPMGGDPMQMGLQPPMQAMQGQRPPVQNALAEMDVDIILESQPDTANIQQEQFQDLIQLVGSNPNYAQTVPFEIMLELSAVPHKRQLIDRLKKAKEEAAQGMAQQQQIAQATAMADLEKTSSETELNKAKTQSELIKPQEAAVRAFQTGHEMAQTPPPGDKPGASGPQNP